MTFLRDNCVNVSAIIISDKSNTKLYLEELPVISISDYQAGKNDGVIVSLANDNQDIDKIKAQLEKSGVDSGNIYLQHVFFRSLCDMNSSAKNGFFSEYHKLNELGQFHGTDKSVIYHNYLNKYEFILSKYVDEPITLLELGVLNGASLRMWKDFFATGRIVGVDIDARCSRYEEDRIDVIIGDLGQREFIDRLTSLDPQIIVDDASHRWSHQINALCNLFPSLKSGGVYILEDITTSFLDEGYNDAIISAYDFCSTVSECVTGNVPFCRKNKSFQLSQYKTKIENIAKNVEMISFLFGSCILIKK